MLPITALSWARNSQTITLPVHIMLCSRGNIQCNDVWYIQWCIIHKMMFNNTIMYDTYNYVWYIQWCTPSTSCQLSTLLIWTNYAKSSFVHTFMVSLKNNWYQCRWVSFIHKRCNRDDRVTHLHYTNTKSMGQMRVGSTMAHTCANNTYL